MTTLTEKQARLKLLENEIKEQEMNLQYKQSKLWKTKLVTGLLIVITVLHIANYKETQKELEVVVKDQADLLEQLKQQQYMAGIQKYLKSNSIEIRLQEVVD